MVAAIQARMDWPEQMRRRTMAFGLDTVRFCRTLPHHVEADVFRRQLLRSGTSVGANYRAACRWTSTPAKRAKLQVALEEADESEYWLLILDAIKMGDNSRRKSLLGEAQELVKILSTAVRNLKNDDENNKPS